MEGEGKRGKNERKKVGKRNTMKGRIMGRKGEIKNRSREEGKKRGGKRET